MEDNLSDINSQKKSEGLGIKSLLIILKAYRVLFIICITIALIDAFLINRYSTPFWYVSVEVLLSNQSKSSEGSEILGTGGFSDDFNFWDPTYVKDKIAFLTSPKFIKPVVEKLNLTHLIFSKGNFKSSLVYNKDLPVEFYYRILDESAYAARYEIEIKKTNFNLRIRNNGEVLFSKKNLKYNDSIVVNGAVLYLKDKKETEKWANLGVSVRPDYTIVLNKIDKVTTYYARRIKIDNLPNTKILTMSLEASEPNVARDFLEEMANTFLEFGLAEKNLKFTKSLEFIDEQLKSAEDVLGNYEGDLKNFKKRMGFMDVSAQSSTLAGERSELDLRLKEQEMLLKSVIALKEYVDKMF